MNKYESGDPSVDSWRDTLEKHQASLEMHRYTYPAGVVVPGAAVTREVIQERVRQEAKWGEQNHPDGTGPANWWSGIFRHSMRKNAAIAKQQVDFDATVGRSTYSGIFLEEVFEALCEDNPKRLREELIQVAAVAVAWVEAIDRRGV